MRRACRPRPSRRQRRSGSTSTSVGASAICRPSATSTCGQTEFTCRPVLKTPSNASWSSSARRRRAGRNCSASPTVRESAQDWRELLLDLKNRGLVIAPELAVADGALGFWKALGELWPTTREQRCWVHKTANVLNKLPKGQQPKAKRALQEIWMAETSKDAEAAFDAFIAAYELKYDKAAECLAQDRQALLEFYDFPAEHWKHLRTSNPIESTFATVRHRTIRSKGCLSNKTALAMVFKLVDAAQKSWRRLDGHNQLPKLIQGVRFTDGIEVVANPASL